MTDTQELVAEYIDLQAQIAERQERVDQIKALLADLDVGKHDYDTGTVTISPNRRLDAGAFTKAFPVTQHPAFYKPSPNTTAIKKEIGENAYLEYCTEGAPKVSVK